MADAEDSDEAKKKEKLTVIALWILFFILVYWIFFR